MKQHLYNADEPVTRWDQPIKCSCEDTIMSPHPIDLSDYNTYALTNESLKRNFPGLCRQCIEKPRPSAYLYLLVTGEDWKQQEAE